MSNTSYDQCVQSIKDSYKGVVFPKKSNIGKRVSTEHGTGKIIGIDLPNSFVPRYIIRIDEIIKPICKILYPKNELCYFSKEVIFI